MSEIAILGSFFLMVMTGVVLAGYLFMNRGGDIDARQIMVDVAARVGQVVPEKGPKVDQTRRKLVLAGYRQESALAVLQGTRAGTAFLAAVLVAWLAARPATGVPEILIAACCGGAFGYLLPDKFLTSIIRRRERNMRYGLPAAIDLMVLSLEAGQSLDSALVETCRELRGAHPELSTEFFLIHLEMMASKSRGEAFRNFADRNSEPEIRRFSQVLIDSDRFGTSLAPALRTHVKYLRLRARQKAREAARKVGVKLVFPVFFLIFPAILVVTLGPAVLQIYTDLIPLLRS